MESSQEEVEQHDPSITFFGGANINPFRKAVERELPGLMPSSDLSYRLETDEEQFRGHMQWFNEVEGIGPLPNDDGEEGEATPNGFIHFDPLGQLWYRQYGHSKWERAVFHYWIRHELGELTQGQDYVFPRKHGLMVGDVTCQSSFQRTWGTERENHPPIMFQYLPPEVPPFEEVNRLMFYGLVVIDFWLSPVKNYREFPLVLSSQYEGDFMEPSLRYNGAIRLEDFRARMPPIVKVVNNGDTILRPLFGLNALSARIRKFWEKAGIVLWDKQKDSDKIKSFVNARLTRLLGDDRHPDLINLSAKELAELRLMGLGTGAKKARSTATPASKKLYVDKVKRKAGVPTNNSMTEATRDVDIQPTNPGPLANPFLFGESADSRYDVPTTAEEHLALSNALQSAADHFKRLTGFEPTPPLDSRACYYTQWTRMQHELRTHWRGSGPAPQLVRLSKWAGGIRNWKVGQQVTSLV